VHQTFLEDFTMRKSMLRIAGMSAMVLLASCSKDGSPSSSNSSSAPNASAASAAKEELDRKDPQAVANAVLSAFKARDLNALAAICTQDNQAMFSEIAAQGEKHPRYASIFSGWRWEAIQKWDGSVGETRYRHYVGTARNEYQAGVKFGEMSPEEWAVVTLTWENGQWAFDDIHSPEPETFKEGATEFQEVQEPY
jgi:hypothetical protein